MDTKLLKIRLERFLARKPLAREVFLNLPRNGKMVRIVLIGDFLEEKFLASLKEKGVEALFISLQDGDTKDPESFPLFIEESRAPLALVVNSSAMETSISATAPAQESSVNFAADNAHEPATVIPPSEKSKLEEVVVSGQQREDELTRVISGKPIETPEEQEHVFSAEAREISQKKIVSSLRASLDEASKAVFKADLENPNPEYKALRDDLALCQKAFAAETGASEQSEETILAVGEAFTEALQRFDQSAEAAAASPLTIELKNALRKTSKTFTEASSIPKPAGEPSGVAKEVFEKHFSAAQKTPEEESAASNASTDSNASTQEFKRDASAPSRSMSVNSRAAVYKELPSMAGRLATYLAHSLGYVSPAFLSDLALGVILYFSQREGKKVEADTLPLLIQAILNNQKMPADSCVEDAQEIVRVLEAYFQNPECDRTQKDFTQKVFQDTLAELKLRPNGLNVWNEVRWAQFVAAGASMTAHSLCAKASAKAIKTSKDLYL